MPNDLRYTSLSLKFTGRRNSRIINVKSKIKSVIRTFKRLGDLGRPIAVFPTGVQRAQPFITLSRTLGGVIYPDDFT